eukprot:164229-Amphidinium_carterae.1
MGAYVCGWTRKQACAALSSAEAELIALTTGLSADSEAARCIALRAGVIPKVKHLGIRALQVGPSESENKGGPKAKEAE